MPLSLAPVLADVGTSYAIQTGATAAVDTLDVNSGVLYKVEIDNTAGTSAVYVKGYDVAGGGTVTVGTTDPQWVFKCPAGVKRAYSSGAGSAFANGLKVACTTTRGTAGTSSPTWTVSYGILTG
tara:strand:- start:205 stop:576 length:372 start_codon:yes stop_codon:yes gene_type:complete